MKSQNPKQLLIAKLTDVMSNLNLWKEDLRYEIPTSWEKYNNYIIFNEKYFRSEEWFKAGSEVWLEVCKVFSVENIALKGRIQSDGYRTPNVKVIWGNSKWVEYVDNGINYSWLVEYSMFCAGNASERHRIATLNCEGETIVDLFAGIGYFTLPFLVYAKCLHVHACEWNSNAVVALKKNLKENNVIDRCTVHEGDNRDMSLANVADRVILGLIPSSRKSWDIACQALKTDSGGVLHIHENVTSKFRLELKENSISEICQICEDGLKNLTIDSTSILPVNVSFQAIVTSENATDSIVNESTATCCWKKYEWLYWAFHTTHTISEILFKLHKKPWKVISKNLSHVKSYAPHIDHLVLDLECRPIDFDVCRRSLENVCKDYLPKTVETITKYVNKM